MEFRLVFQPISIPSHFTEDQYLVNTDYIISDKTPAGATFISMRAIRNQIVQHLSPARPAPVST